MKGGRSIVKIDGSAQIMVVLTIKEIRYAVLGPFDDLVGPLTYLYL